MKFEKLNERQSDNCQVNDTYTTKYDRVVTYKITDASDASKRFIIRIDYSQNNHVSSSWNDKVLTMLTPNGWVNLGTSRTISQTYPTSDQYDCRLDGIKENCDLWFQACKEYFEAIHEALV